ncbi:glycerophosphodiester phosphodiesterase [Ornithinibacillus halophilus]|uniref:Glycerophosphoryl diester phosphodiesterase n=1 Tax=Ornithinibacillus halophilus TaxID=930117 RepID=A0A1M5HSD9_9BACI|nr:glycerophosphodiester phosphodiesterase [Ornithinibacillus halophilus]SHG18894.1 glycerophosphoryl diester phosphodiesterase [Ornithinibacillus halophilus]
MGNTNPIEKSSQQPIKKKKSKLKWIGFGLIGILLVWGILYIFPSGQIQQVAYFDNERPLVIAHQGGEHLAPSSTMVAFQQAVEIGVDVLEFDVHMTKDDYLVAIHDPTVDRTTDGEGKVIDLTLEEIQKLDAGYYFQDLEGEYSYRGQGIHIPTVEEIFNAYPNMKYVIEIKDTNEPELYQTVSEALWQTIEKHGLEEKVLIASFDHAIIDLVKEVSDGEALVSGGREEIKKFVILHKLFLNGLYSPTVEAVQIPTEDSNINLMDKKIIRGAERKGMDVHYWTINDKEMMEQLIDLDAGGIITDRPDLLIELLDEKY